MSEAGFPADQPLSEPRRTEAALREALDSLDVAVEQITDAECLRRAAQGDPLVLARFTRAVLEENGLSYREQEVHTGVTPSVVYNLAFGRRVSALSLQQFASVAAMKARRRETRVFWGAVFERLSREREDGNDAPPQEEALPVLTDPSAVTPEQVAILYAALRQPQSRAAVVKLIDALHTVEDAVASVDLATGGEGASERASA